ncbi:haloacid dehalogenase [Pseudozyma hubeiensis SY62]|uniref:Haloacid dehalogenase n=1 Tax=Pseudozyma hubeiensis (strain SY62) TaxID=1305764 RepID=R9P0C1_PSEHS|nr:haloacid dehalogenase [Pseudozyma hubeiensis SY62]GAC94534.1 haloacid dehalogenase [Pseudozyma hubeiensis SY62]
MAFDVYAEGGSDMHESRARLAQLLESLGDALPAELQHVRREEAETEPSSQPGPDAGPAAAAAVATKEATVATDANHEAGPSHPNGQHPHTAQRTEFETEWARLPTAITTLPSFCKIKQLIMRHSTGKTSFRFSLPVLSNGIDHCYMSRPAFRQVLLDLDGEYGEQIDDPAEDAGLLPPSPDPLTLTEALWESHFGVPRHLRWYSTLADFEDGVASCIQVHFAPPNPGRLGLSRILLDSPNDVVHCGVAGTKRPVYFVGPTSGLLYTVVQGSILVVSWPNTDHNFDAWLKWNRKINNRHHHHYDDLEDPRINLLRTGDTVYLAAGTTNLMVAFSHVAMTSRQVLNPTSRELATIIRCCHRLMDSYIEQQSIGYSPFDEMEVERMDANLITWMALALNLTTGKPSVAVHQLGSPYKAAYKFPTKKITTNERALQEFLRGVRQVSKKIERYRQMVSEATKNTKVTSVSGCPHNRPFDTLNALAKLSSSADAEGAVGSPGDHSDADMLHLYVRSSLSLKGKDRAPN